MVKVAGQLNVTGTLSNAGTIDLVLGTMVPGYAQGTTSCAEEVRQQLLAGRAGGQWNGTGLLSSQAAADAQKRTAIGYAEASRLGIITWSGTDVDNAAVVTRLTYYGNADLDGRIHADDYTLIDCGYATQTAGVSWTDGDFDYSGTVDQADYLLIDRVFLQQGNPMSPAFLAAREARFGLAYVTELVAAVPEPSGLPAMTATLAGLASSAGRHRRDRL